MTYFLAKERPDRPGQIYQQRTAYTNHDLFIVNDNLEKYWLTPKVRKWSNGDASFISILLAEIPVKSIQFVMDLYGNK